MNIDSDFYFKIFNIEKISDINRKELKRRYRILVRKYHPDNKEFGNAAKFRLIQDANEYIKRLLDDFLKEDDKKFFNPNFYFYGDGSIYDLKNKKWARLKDSTNPSLWKIYNYKVVIRV